MLKIKHLSKHLESSQSNNNKYTFLIKWLNQLLAVCSTNLCNSRWKDCQMVAWIQIHQQSLHHQASFQEVRHKLLNFQACSPRRTRCLHDNYSNAYAILQWSSRPLVFDGVLTNEIKPSTLRWMLLQCFTIVSCFFTGWHPPQSKRCTWQRNIRE